MPCRKCARDGHARTDCYKLLDLSVALLPLMGFQLTLYMCGSDFTELNLIDEYL